MKQKKSVEEYLNFLKDNGFTVTGRAVYGGALALTYAEAKVRERSGKEWRFEAEKISRRLSESNLYPF